MTKGRNVIDRRNVPYVIVTRQIIEDEGLKAADKSVYSVLCMYADNKTMDCHPSRETIMKKAGIGDHALRNSIRKLTEKGYIAVEKRTNYRGQATNLYILLDVSDIGKRV